MKKLLEHLYIAWLLFRLGYWFSKNTHDGETWGFYRVNFRDDYALLDFDFSRGQKCRDYVHMHGGPNEANYTVHRWDAPLPLPEWIKSWKDVTP